MHKVSKSHEVKFKDGTVLNIIYTMSRATLFTLFSLKTLSTSSQTDHMKLNWENYITYHTGTWHGSFQNYASNYTQTQSGQIPLDCVLDKDRLGIQQSAHFHYDSGPFVATSRVSNTTASLPKVYSVVGVDIPTMPVGKEMRMNVFSNGHRIDHYLSSQGGFIVVFA